VAPAEADTTSASTDEIDGPGSVLQLKEALLQAGRKGDIEGVRLILRQLSQLSVSVTLLRRTGIGVLVNSLRGPVMRDSQALVRLWRERLQVDDLPAPEQAPSLSTQLTAPPPLLSLSTPRAVQSTGKTGGICSSMPSASRRTVSPPRVAAKPAVSHGSAAVTPFPPALTPGHSGADGDTDERLFALAEAELRAIMAAARRPLTEADFAPLFGDDMDPALVALWVEASHNLAATPSAETTNNTELDALFAAIIRLGTMEPDGSRRVRFISLFRDAVLDAQVNSLAATLRLARQRGLLTFPGAVLLQGVDDDVNIVIPARA
jgi:hypothetical protein